MGAQSRLVWFSPPAGTVWNHQMTILDCRKMRKQLVVPRHTVHVNFHDAEVRHSRGEMSIHHGAQVAVKIVRGDVDLVSLSRGGDLHRLTNAVPHGVDYCDIH